MKEKGFCRTKKFLKVACLAASMAMASWGGGGAAQAAQTYEISGSITPNNALTNVYFVTSYYTPGSSGSLNYAGSIGNVGGPPNVTTFSLGPINEVNYFSAYSVIGLYDYENNGVTVGMSSTQAQLAFGKSWATFFNTAEYPNNHYTEEIVAGWLKNGDADSLWNLSSFIQYFYNEFDADLGTDITLVNFSDGANGGSATANAYPVPLPPTLALMIPGLGVVLLLRRKKSDKG